jgi:hypothetical protein
MVVPALANPSRLYCHSKNPGEYKDERLSEWFSSESDTVMPAWTTPNSS